VGIGSTRETNRAGERGLTDKKSLFHLIGPETKVDLIYSDWSLTVRSGVELHTPLPVIDPEERHSGRGSRLQ
jgi:hypothetical protein